MTASDFGSISPANHRSSRWRCPVLASSRLRHRPIAPSRASESLYSGLPEIDEPRLVVVTGDRYRKARPPLTDDASQLAAHLRDVCRRVLDPCARLGDALVAQLLTVGQRLVVLALPLDLAAKGVFFQPGSELRRAVAAIDIDIPARVGRIVDVVEVLAVVRTGGVGLEPADELVVLVDGDRQLVAEVALTVLLGPDGIQILLAPLRGLSLRWHCTLLDEFLLAPALALLGRRHRTRVDDLLAAGDTTPLLQLRQHAVERRLRAGLADAVLEGPNRRTFGDVRRIAQAADALVAHAIEQLALHLVIVQVVKALQNQDAHHRLDRVRRRATLRTRRVPRDAINLGHQRSKVDVRLHLGKRSAQLVDLLAVVFVGEQVGLDRATRFHRGCLQQGSGPRNLPRTLAAMFFELPTRGSNHRGGVGQRQFWNARLCTGQAAGCYEEMRQDGYRKLQ